MSSLSCFCGILIWDLNEHKNYILRMFDSGDDIKFLLVSCILPFSWPPFSCWPLSPWSNSLTCGYDDNTLQQKVYVKGGKKEEEPLELEVYNQGMFKTELCNKWQETGACPYGEHCQFAHGIEELRPVLRHPRYKTEVCRMVLSGDHCPYGHRCHFRHTLTDQEKLIKSMNLRSFKDLNR